MLRPSILLVLPLLLSSCDDGRPPAPSAEESDQLNAAERLLDEEAADAKGPEAAAPGPSE